MSSSPAPGETGPRSLPKSLKHLFWDVPFRRLTWERDRDFVIGRVLASGSWEDIRWLRTALGDDGLRNWITEHRAAGLERRQVRFWQVVLGLPARQVDSWLADPARAVWDNRTAG